jgi:hypothetical protein
MLNNLSNIINNEIDIMTVDDLVKSGFQKDHAVKLVTEFEFDPIEYFLQNPIADTETVTDF